LATIAATLEHAAFLDAFTPLASIVLTEIRIGNSRTAPNQAPSPKSSTPEFAVFLFITLYQYFA
jgi:hypothetical protein